MEHEGTLFIPCDLGFIWHRVSPPIKWVMALVWTVKRWHKDVLQDGRIVLRTRGRRYSFRAVRVEDPMLVEKLKSEIDEDTKRLIGQRLSSSTKVDVQIRFILLDPR